MAKAKSILKNWEVKTVNRYGATFIEVWSGGKCIRPGNVLDLKIAQAIANLMAAAPEMLEALRAMYMVRGNQARLEKAMLKAEAALTKAEGGS